MLLPLQKQDINIKQHGLGDNNYCLSINNNTNQTYFCTIIYTERTIYLLIEINNTLFTVFSLPLMAFQLQSLYTF